MKKDEAKRVMARRCECGLPWGEHSFAEFVTCQYGGQPLKGGGVFTIETANEVVAAIIEKLSPAGRDEGER